MIDDKELIRRALMGDKQAQKECTAKGIVLPCPLCGSKATIQQDITGKESYHVVCNNVKDMCNLISGLTTWGESEENALKAWNTRPAPPIGRCGKCKYFYSCISGTGCTNPLGMYQTEMTEMDFCSCFEPKTTAKNQTYKPAELIEDKTSSGLLEE